MLRFGVVNSVLLAVALTAPLPVQAQTATQIAWIKNNAAPLNGTEPGQGFGDLQPLKDLIGDARIVAIGEGTHGTHEFFRLRHRLIEFLASEMGFTIVAVEAQMGESYAINDYVRGGKGRPEALLADLVSFSVGNREVLELIQWMRRFNESRDTPLQFMGIDMLLARAAARQAENYLRQVDPTRAEHARQVFTDAARARRAPFGLATATIPISAAAGKKIRYTGQLRTLDVKHGYAGLWLRVDNKAGRHFLENVEKNGARGTTPWREYSIEATVPEDATRVTFGMLHTGDGTAWFDSLRMEIDGSLWKIAQCDLDFESEDTKCLAKSGDQYNLALAGDAAFSGKQSFRILYMGSEPPDSGPPVDLAKVAEQCRGAIADMESSKEAYVVKSSAREFQRTLQSARLALQRVEVINGRTSRDQCMAENLRWIVDQSPPGTKIILWAHNAHVARIKDWLGGYLNDWYGKDMVVIGMVCSQGRYLARDPKDLRIGDLRLPPPDSVEHYLGSAGIPRFMIDLRRAATGEPGSDWPKEKLQSRFLGGLIAENQFIPWPVSFNSLFDTLIYMAETTAAKPLN